MTQIILLAHASSTLALVGLIWFVQIVHYPLFELGERASFPTLASRHQRRTGFVVVPLMLIELVTATFLAASPPAGAAALTATGWLILLVVWLSTFFVQVPQHRRLLSGFRHDAFRRLVAGNWIRTTGWTARGFIALALIARDMAS